MSLNIGNGFIFLSVLILSAIYSPIVSAQNKERKQFLSVESQLKTLETEVEAVSEKLRVGRATNVPNALQPNDRRRENVFEVKSDDESVEKIERSNINRQVKTNEFTYHFRSTDRRERQIDFEDSAAADKNEFSFRSSPTKIRPLDDTKNPASSDDAAPKKPEGFRWRSAIGQSLMFLAIQHGYATTQPKTREALKGKFWKDYVDSVKSLHGWADGGRFFTNYIAHPMQGAFLGYIQVQNDPNGMKQQFGTSKDYWHSRLKAMAWSAAWSTQFEIGPVSQASIGNVGLKGKQTYIDIVITPTVGTAWLIGEDAIDRLIIKRIERATDNFYVKMFSRGLLNPTRTIANLFRFKVPWHRDRPREH